LAYNIIPSSIKEIKKFNNNEILDLYNICLYYDKDIIDPIAINKDDLNIIKITRKLTDKFHLIKNDFKGSIKIKLGDGSRGNKGINNKGLLFEKELFHDFSSFFEFGNIDKIKYKNFIIDFYQTEELYKHDNIKIIEVGSLNKKRPLTFSDDYILIGTSANVDIGETISDLTIMIGTESKYLSLKFGRTISLFNIGLKKILLESEIKDNNIQNEKANLLLSSFGIDSNLFCNQFNTLSGCGNVYNLDYDYDKINTLLKSGIGYNYYFVHKIKDINYEFITENKMNKMSEIKDIYCNYPNFSKRVNLYIKNDELKININFRDKDGNVYPSQFIGNYIK
jgi:hypothetical protein